MRKHAYQQPEVVQLLLLLDMPAVQFERPRFEAPAPYVDKTEHHDFSAETGEFMSNDPEEEIREVYRSLTAHSFRP